MELGLIGYPIQHSKSPWIHQQFLKQAGLSGEYILYEIHPDQFVEEIKQLKQLSLDGFNVTVPYKQKIIPYLDEIDDHAQTIGAVNTVVCRNGKWHGYNTDGLGLVTALKVRYPHLFEGNKSALILGAGGASRGIYYALIKEKLNRVSIANRTKSKAESIMNINSQDRRGEVFTYQEAECHLASFDLIIQTTSVGMYPNNSEKIINLTHIQPDTVVSDIVYQPFWTSLLREAHQKGAQVHHGHEMLLYQGKLAFEYWTNKKINANEILPKFLTLLQSENNKG
ncbi:shikimate dehydrogenase [Amphibacillus cookii]|uniref:shikimate dehydrogenase n=1 Tax=Amphibacillus cookii TaxID=767787 RepID=UPI00195CC586|nr:shikimate dehydrogenase [Amphibacillus cookii]MBM7541701.1 shikimate dehydrogenase [Amphibacillus cookii]